ncbi:MAG: CDP-alcohol phosphatidyltransferase family protein [Chloroflexi bacterium]|nr:CDP-alcohol phosphatidyltransferase family protein [Chloroflexota bacterium]
MHEGFVSRYLNRRFSRPIARALAHTPVTPNQVSFIAFLMAAGAAALFYYDLNIWAGILVQASSIVDGVDGDLARAKNMASRFGGFFDALLDRYADAVILAGLGYWAFKFQAGADQTTVTLLAGVAIVGSLMISYSRARAEATFGQPFEGLPGALASRDLRLFVIMIGAIIGQGVATLAVIGVLTNMVVLWRLGVARWGNVGERERANDKPVHL